MLNLDAICNGVIQKHPYHWIFFDNLIPKPQLVELFNSFPYNKFPQRPGGLILDQGAEVVTNAEKFFNAAKNEFYIYPLPNLNSLWQTLVDELISPAYREAVTKLTGLNLEHYLIRIYLSQIDSTANKNLAPHKDSWFVNNKDSGMALSHLFYFSKDWDINWGGSLQILENEHRESVVKEIPPQLGNSVLFLCEHNAWHVVSPISPNAVQPRQHLMVRFYDRQIYTKYLKGE
ncbi:2OG-Fe(II) oxygenase [Nostocaceae cyanobacterium CENA369]|uniref:2OG-Fe(II) oxygenase n=1 Tax=Dendronalium phyllosphericum CENA369 TaxID=1725256 RepID=A0A8J7I5Y8_9NOST|nr:2OG-Fe(II) oxygenase [Dendronalium phyllosphericum]MBH8576645.1 2OG-Fe(II) oxygenase [Dendronalium phyllosphericum CENA369]